MWRRVDVLWTDVSEERIASIFRVYESHESWTRVSARQIHPADGHSVYSYLLTLVHRSWISYTMKMEAIRSTETSVNKISTWCHIPEDGILHSHRRENLKSHKVLIDSQWGFEPGTSRIRSESSELESAWCDCSQRLQYISISNE
jgi:hypothetical protein